jgi:hypothetical protein
MSLDSRHFQLGPQHSWGGCFGAKPEEETTDTQAKRRRSDISTRRATANQKNRAKSDDLNNSRFPRATTNFAPVDGVPHPQIPAVRVGSYP